MLIKGLKKHKNLQNLILNFGTNKNINDNCLKMLSEILMF